MKSYGPGATFFKYSAPGPSCLNEKLGPHVNNLLTSFVSSFSLVVSSDPVWRDKFYDGHPKQENAAVVLRVAPSWFRIGSLEILATQREHELLRLE